jgi:hypothetical protein
MVFLVSANLFKMPNLSQEKKQQEYIKIIEERVRMLNIINGCRVSLK